ncbi:MAG: ribokinase [Porticoccus sp.]
MGGDTANVAISMAQQGFDIDILALVGDDHNGKTIRQTSNDQGIGLDHFFTEPNTETGSSILIYFHDQNAAIFTYRRANTCLTRYFIRSIFRTINWCTWAGCYVATNPDTCQLTDHIDEFLSVAHESDYLSLNKVETVALLSQLALSHNNSSNIHTIEMERTPLLMETGLHVGGFWLALKEAIEAIRHAGTTYFSLTDGTECTYLFEDKTLFYCPSNDMTPWRTTGAEDAFASTIAAQLVSGYGPERTLYAATCSVVEHVDTQTGLLTAAAINQIAMDNPPSCYWVNEANRSLFISQ